MLKNQSSLTAAGIAIARTGESEKPADKRIFYVPYARRFVSVWMYHLLGFFIKIGYAELRGPGVNGFLMAREWYIDDVLQNILNESLRPLVFLGTGNDSRTYRFMTSEELTFGIPEGTERKFLRARGFQQVEDVSTDELKAAYFTGINANRKVVGGYSIVIRKV